VEINEALGAETKALFEAAGFTAVELRKDLNGKDRMIRLMIND
jgi:methylase of polypeptide subunit release factors